MFAVALSISVSIPAMKGSLLSPTAASSKTNRQNGGFWADSDSFAKGMNRTATKLTEEARDGKPIYCVQWPKFPKGRNRKYFKEKIEAETFLKQKLVEKKSYGDEGMAFGLR